MIFDVQTLGLVLLLVYLGNLFLSGLMAGSGRTFPGARLWVLAQAVLALGALASFLRPWLPGWIPIVVGNAAYAAACLPFVHAAWAFRFRKPFPRLAYLVLVFVVLSLVLVQGQPFSTRVVVFSLWQVVGAFVVAGVLYWNIEHPYRMANSITALPFVLIGGGALIRLIINLFWPADDEFLSPQGINGLYLMGAILIAPVTLFGYFMMTGIRAEQVLELKDEEIKARNRKLMESNRAKDLFFSIIAHDLRGPIGGSARYVRKHLLAKMSGLEPKFAEVETLAAALEKTNEFLEKLLWWSRAQLLDWVPNRKPLDLDMVLEQALSLVRSAADLKEIPVTFSEAPYPRPVADAESVGLIVGNLLSNAVKFSLPGHPIRIQVSEHDGLCRISVIDEGIGMDAQTLDRLFRIEDKLTTHGTSGERGSGLGLLLAQSLAERNDGGIVMESEPGVGTKATLWLPMVIPSPHS